MTTAIVTDAGRTVIEAETGVLRAADRSILPTASMSITETETPRTVHPTTYENAASAATSAANTIVMSAPKARPVPALARLVRVQGRDSPS